MSTHPSKRPARFVAGFLSALLLLSPTAYVQAHSLGLGLSEFYSGLLHPFALFVYLLPLAALSIIAGQQGQVASRRALPALILGLIIGLAISRAWPYRPIHTVLLYSVFIGTGIVAAASAKIPSVLLCISICGCGILFGLLNGFEANETNSFALFSSGNLLGYSLVFLWTTALVTKATKDWMQIGFRILGSWVAAVGILLIGLFA